MDIVLENIYKEFKDKCIFERANYIFKDKNISFILGPSGVGKTTLLKILMGLETIENGKIKGIDNRKISAVFQEDAFCEEMSCINNIRLVRRNIDREKLENYFKKMDMLDYIDRPVKNLSGGMKRRLAIIRAMAYNGDTYIMDEPFKGLDEETKKTVIDFLLENIREKTVIIVTHDLEEVEYIKKSRECDIYYLNPVNRNNKQ